MKLHAIHKGGGHEKHSFGEVPDPNLCVNKCTNTNGTDTYRDTGTGNCREPTCADDADIMNPGATLTLPGEGKCISPSACATHLG